MKKILALLLALMLAVGLAACGKKEEETKGESKDKEKEEVVEEEVEGDVDLHGSMVQEGRLYRLAVETNGDHEGPRREDTRVDIDRDLILEITPKDDSLALNLQNNSEYEVTAMKLTGYLSNTNENFEAKISPYSKPGGSSDRGKVSVEEMEDLKYLVIEKVTVDIRTEGVTLGATVTYDVLKDAYSIENEERLEGQPKESTGTKSSSNDKKDTKKDSGSSTSWKQFLKDYERWVDKYVDITKKYQKNPTDTKLADDYMKLMGELSDWSKKADKVQGDLSDSDLTEYLNTMSRILDKLSKIQ